MSIAIGMSQSEAMSEFNQKSFGARRGGSKLGLDDGGSLLLSPAVSFSLLILLSLLSSSSMTLIQTSPPQQSCFSFFAVDKDKAKPIENSGTLLNYTEAQSHCDFLLRFG